MSSEVEPRGLIPPPSSEGQAAIRRAAILAVRDGDPSAAAQWLETCWAEAAVDKPGDRLYFANAVIQLALIPLISDQDFLRCVDHVRRTEPLLDEPQSLRSEYTRYLKPKPDPPRPIGGLFTWPHGARRKDAEPSSDRLAEARERACSVLNEAIAMLQSNDLEEGRRLAVDAVERFRRLHDQHGEAVALHIQGRIEHEMGRLDDAMSRYTEALALARYYNDDAQVARSTHERSRILHTRDHDFISAEQGYRHALTYYASIGDLANLQTSIDCLCRLAEEALMEDSPFLPKLERDGVPVGSPPAYLHICAVVIKAEFLVRHQRYMRLLLRWADQELPRDRALARYILSEAKRVAVHRDDQEFIDAIEALKWRLSVSA